MIEFFPFDTSSSPKQQTMNAEGIQVLISIIILSTAKINIRHIHHQIQLRETAVFQVIKHNIDELYNGPAVVIRVL